MSLPKKNLNLLAIETSGPRLSLALKTGAGKITRKNLPGRMNHDRFLIPCMDRMLRKNGLALADIDVFLIGRGPGSFTGLRVGFAALKALRLIRKKPCYGAQSLDMIAEGSALPEGSELAVCMDAHRGKVFFRRYLRKRGRWIARNQTRALTPDLALSEASRSAVFLGSALKRYGEKFPAPAGSKRVPDTDGHPRADALIRLFEKRDPKLRPLNQGVHFVPLYFRSSEAEERKKQYAARR